MLVAVEDKLYVLDQYEAILQVYIFIYVQLLIVDFIVSLPTDNHYDKRVLHGDEE